MTSAATAMRRTRPGRPRHIPARSQLEPREQILDAAARLFTERGFAATSTREIAEMVGMRQASLYYHFPCGKEEILGDLLDMTVRPTLDGLDELAEIDPPEAKLYVLAFRDARALAGLMHNIGLLPTLPDVTSTEVCDEYEQARRLLREAYSTLGISCASDVVVETVSRAQLGAMVIQQVEGVVRDRAAGEVVTSYELHNVAAACLRICGVPDERIPSIGDISPLLTDAS